MSWKLVGWKTRLFQYLQRFWPQAMTGGWGEKYRAAVGALCGILFTGLIAQYAVNHDPVATFFLIAPMGASSVFCLRYPVALWLSHGLFLAAISSQHLWA